MRQRIRKWEEQSMHDLGLDVTTLKAAFRCTKVSPYVFIEVKKKDADNWPAVLSEAIRRCYLADDLVEKNVERTKKSKAVVIASKLPDPGSTMSGDFGELITYIYQATREHPKSVIGPKKWQMKQDRSKPAPYSDVVQFIVPAWPNSSSEDTIMCAEVKTKATASKWRPISKAIQDCKTDRTGRLVKTLMWLQERALTEELGSVSLAHLDRFINATEHPPAKTLFSAVAVVCNSLVTQELKDAPLSEDDDFTVVVISIADLKNVYESVFDAVNPKADNTGVLG